MPTVDLIWLVILFFVTSVVGVVTGSNSLITVPVMFQFGIDPKVAVATNMFGLTFMNIGATIPFLLKGEIGLKKTSPLVFITVFSSAIGALLVGLITSESIKLIVSIAMICVTVFVLLQRDSGVVKNSEVSRKALVFTFALTFLLGIYGGLYSGGYVTILTVVLVAFYGMSFSESIASTKFINVFSSLIATLIFMWQGLVNYKLGAILALTMFIGAFIGAHTATKMNDIWLKRIFILVVLVLALKTILDYV